MSTGKNMIYRMLSSADLDAELMSGLPILEITGNDRILIENHLSVAGYSCDSICVKVSYGCICISGRQLTIVKMTKNQLVICGNIQAVHLSTKG